MTEMRLRTILAACSFLAMSAAPVLTPGLNAAWADEPPARVRNIEVSAQNSRFNLLVRLDAQPSGASVMQTADGFILRLSGVSLSAFSVTPPETGPIARATVAMKNGDAVIRFIAADVSDLSTTIYRQAVLVEGRTLAAYPARRASHVTAVSSMRAPTPPSAPRAPMAPVAPTPPAPPSSSSIWGIAHLSTVLCVTARQSVMADPWDLDQLGAHVLCLVSDNHMDDAAPLVEQLESFSPDNWRGPLARAEILRARHETEQALSAYSLAIVRADTPDVQHGIRARMDAYANHVQSPSNPHAAPSHTASGR